jgi:hypothetical protein
MIYCAGYSITYNGINFIYNTLNKYILKKHKGITLYNVYNIIINYGTSMFYQ